MTASHQDRGRFVSAAELERLRAIGRELAGARTYADRCRGETILAIVNKIGELAGMPIVVDDRVPPGELRAVDPENGAILARIVDLPVETTPGIATPSSFAGKWRIVAAKGRPRRRGEGKSS